MESSNNTAEEEEEISFHSVKQKWARQEQLTNAKQTTPVRTTTLNSRPFVADPVSVSGLVPAALAPPAVAPSLRKNPFEDDIPADDPPNSSASLIASAFEARIAELTRPGTSRPSSVSSLELQSGSRTPVNTSRPSTPPQPTATAAVTLPNAAASDPSELPLSQRVSLLTQQFRTADAAQAPSSAPRTPIRNSLQSTVPAPSKRSSLVAPSRAQQTFQPAAAAIIETDPFAEQDEEANNAVQDEMAPPQRPARPVSNNSAGGTSPAKRTPPPPPPSRRPRGVQAEGIEDEPLPPIPQRPAGSVVEKPALPARPALPVRPALAQGIKQNMEAVVMNPTQLSHLYEDEGGVVFDTLPPSLPPRPGQVVDDTRALPKLPPRRASSYISRATTTAPDKPPALPSRPGATDSGARVSQQLTSEPLKTYDTDSTAEFLPKPDPRRFSSPAEKHATLAPTLTSAITNISGFNRRPPTIPSSGRSEIQHKGPFKSLAISGSYIVTGMNQTRIWDSTTGDNIRTIHHAQGSDARVLSMAFAPTLHPDDDGRYLWTGLQDGQLWCIDIRTGEKITSVSNAHSHPVTHILRRAQIELWTLDDSGVLQCWSDRSPQGFDDAGALTLNGHARRLRVAQRQSHACVVGDRLWTADARAIEVFNVSADDPGATSLTLRPLSAGSDVGNITALCVTPDATRVYVAHDDGKVSMWDPTARVRVGVVSISPYGIAAMAVVTGGVVWAGFNTGMVYIYDTKPEIWTVQKAWKAVQGPVQALVVDVTGLVREGMERVACVEAGNVKVYDGLMTEDWIGE